MTNLALAVQIPAQKWDAINRRLRWLEAALVQILGNGEGIREWLDAAELAGLEGLPETRSGVTRVATARQWRRRIITGRGGERYQYHYTAIPGRAFDALLKRIGRTAHPATTATGAPWIETPPVAEKPAVRRLPDNAAPPWVLPFMRLMKGAGGDMAAAWRSLPANLPTGVCCPDLQEAAQTLVRLGIYK